MNTLAVVLIVAQAVFLQNAYAQYPIGGLIAPGPIVAPSLVGPSCGCGVSSPLLAGSVYPSSVLPGYPPVISGYPPAYPSTSVANNLADTLNILTVSSLLADKLPFGYPNVIPSIVAPACSAGGCGCGCGFGNGYGYYY